jgi:hypothetical protein
VGGLERGTPSPEPARGPHELLPVLPVLPESSNPGAKLLRSRSASSDAETSAFYLARASLLLRTLETEAAELRIVLAAVERETVRRWRLTQPGDAKP